MDTTHDKGQQNKMDTNNNTLVTTGWRKKKRETDKEMIDDIKKGTGPVQNINLTLQTFEGIAAVVAGGGRNPEEKLQRIF
ncbi:hypothetical protein EVAR_49744_1 [Eumeta japonica]|uniref:Uncharacterized protein n=1 Tax=Eumeta variegata TaxID=151549 RepID=A0A4C1YB36_EUMVA|nr:hypothetical protein EVAR_49744_1 [Eumeta japonica]